VDLRLCSDGEEEREGAGTKGAAEVVSAFVLASAASLAPAVEVEAEEVEASAAAASAASEPTDCSFDEGSRLSIRFVGLRRARAKGLTEHARGERESRGVWFAFGRRKTRVRHTFSSSPFSSSTSHISLTSSLRFSSSSSREKTPQPWRSLHFLKPCCAMPTCRASPQ